MTTTNTNEAAGLGPRCPRCHCRDGRDVGELVFAGRVRITRECRHCGKAFSYKVEAPPVATTTTVNTAPAVTMQADGVAVYEHTRCPCGSARTKVLQTRKPRSDGAIRRNHVCRDCGQRFTSIERPAPAHAATAAR